ncbi:N-acetylglucosaminyl-diphospho-decaprenol L-rhamnosyltransferase [Sphingomonas dokdonensis]|uniref:N-acetylglucosaminyl-diphospho-decaprenol L-rhamnosyltransferase n=1 Tax=Sphingomonas dokdonensis TaxID=344880 RepID=A0A245ZVN8_9SPHN|nr:N-acetylglucosaminyl-diphospho-decaprenol L-rhamnosyltransferase [Sphingomonas dokdonensis]
MPAARPATDRIDKGQSTHDDGAARWRKILAVAEAFASERLADEALAASLGYPIEAYDQFRRDIAVRPPPPSSEKSSVPTVLVDARDTEPYLLRATLRSLQDQSVGDWSARVIAPAAICEGPVASFADTDPRIHFKSSAAFSPVAGEHAILLDAGTVLDPEALAWFSFALLRTGAAAVFADEDRGVADPDFGLLRADPLLFGMFDEALVSHGVVPAVVALAGPLPDQAGAGSRGAALLAAAGRGMVAHVPRVLVTRLEVPLVARGGRIDAPGEGREETPGEPAARTGASPAQGGRRIAVVIPTRDEARLLARAIQSLRSTASQPDRLDIVVVDNRSVLPETTALLDRLIMAGTARVVPFDSAFNWSLASNRGAAASDAPLIVFANNDIEMLSAGWDELVEDWLGQSDVGAVGARLLYPDRTIQHAGIAFGFGPTGTEHEGRGVPAPDSGPGGRYTSPHRVSAVTGAFLAVRRSDFEQVGGFDAARLMIGHSDIDLCLRLRDAGRTILYCPAIQAIHHEGATRGRNETQAAIAWDEGERIDLVKRWGGALNDDPGVSPYWRRGERPFAFLREPTMREILAHIDRSARADPWRPHKGQSVPHHATDMA